MHCTRQKLIMLIGIAIILTSGCYGSVELDRDVSKARPLLIEWGQASPDVRQMRKHVAYWEEYLPFDGVTMSVNADRYAGRYGDISADALDPNYWSLAWQVFSDRLVNPADYAGAIEDLKKTPFKKFKHNFLLLLSHPHNNFEPDWFDDEYWGTVCRNAAVLARIAKQGGCKGIFFDNEQYPTNMVWNYSHLRKVHQKRPQDFEAYRRQLRKRGREFIMAINSEYPGIDFMMTFGSSLMHARMGGKDAIANLMDMETDLNGDFSRSVEVLLASFIDGMIEGADAGTTIIDGYELSYYYKTEKEFQRAEKVVRQDCKRYSLDAELYADRIGLGFGLYPTTFSHSNPKRVFTPKELAKSVELAMKYTDKYVWIWNERHSFWIKGGPGGAPLLSDYAMMDARYGLPMLLTYPATKTSVLRRKYRGVETEYIDAIFEGKAKALSNYEKNKSTQ